MTCRFCMILHETSQPFGHQAMAHVAPFAWALQGVPCMHKAPRGKLWTSSSKRWVKKNWKHKCSKNGKFGKSSTVKTDVRGMMVGSSQNRVRHVKNDGTLRRQESSSPWPPKWLVYKGKSHPEMDDDWGYPRLWTPPLVYLSLSLYLPIYLGAIYLDSSLSIHRTCQ